MAKSEFIFVWDEDTLSWVATAYSVNNRRVSQSVPASVETQINGARRLQRNGKDYLFIPMSEEENLYEIAPNFKPDKTLPQKAVEKVVETFKENVEFSPPIVIIPFFNFESSSISIKTANSNLSLNK